MQAVEVRGYYRNNKCRIRFENADGTDFFTTTTVECKDEDVRIKLHEAIFNAYWGEDSRFCGQWLLEYDNHVRVVVACEKVLDKDALIKSARSSLTGSALAINVFYKIHCIQRPIRYKLSFFQSSQNSLSLAFVMRPYRILFACPQTLFDVSNGASLQCSTMLWALARAGVQCMSIGGGIFDNPSGLARIPDLAQQIEANKDRDILINTDYSASKDNPIKHCFFTGFKSTVWRDMTLREADKFLIEFTKILRTFKPDLIMGYGCDPLCRSMWEEAKLHGIPWAYIICNGNHKNFRFPLIDVLLTDSETTVKYYRDAEHLDLKAVGEFINPAAVIAPKKTDSFVTFINPCYQKGVGAVARLILMANKERPDIKFQIIETREKFVSALQVLRNPDDEKLGTAFKNQTFSNIAIRPAMSRVSEIYAASSVVLAPSFGYESWGRVATEAVMNGIPVLASDRGGLVEAVNGGGYNLSLPEYITDETKTWTILPREEDMRQWADKLYELYDNRETWREKCLKAAENLSPEVSVQRLLTILKPYLDKLAGDTQNMNILGSIRFQEDPLKTSHTN